MSTMLTYLVILLFGCLPSAQAFNKDNHHRKGLGSRLSKWSSHHLVGWEETSKCDPATTGNATFRQYIDHQNPHLGTFSQFYFWSTEFWGGPGSPVIVMTPGEVNVTGYTSYLTTNRTTGVLAQEIGAAIIVIEHRYWGESSPYADLTTENLQYLTLENSIVSVI